MISAKHEMSALASYALRLGDDSLVLGQRVSAWCSHAPEMEIDLALANIALDLLGRARGFLGRACELEGLGRNEDDLAFGRDVHQFRNALLVEHPNEDFAVTIARQFLFDAFDHVFLEHLSRTSDPVLSAVAAKAVKETAYHVRFSRQWLLRLGDGTEESHRRMQAGLDRVYPFLDDVFGMDKAEQDLAAEGYAVDRPALRESVLATIRSAVDEAGLQITPTSWSPSGGHRGQHGECLGYLLAEMQWMQRAYPGCEW